MKTMLIFIQKWRWRGSNPRPNEESICFLHAYSSLHCRVLARPGPPTSTLVCKFHAVIQTLTTLFPIFCASLIQSPQDLGLGRRLVAVILTAIKLTYCTSVRLQEHSYSRQLNFWSQDYSASHQRTACLHTASARCQNRSSPYLRCNPVRLLCKCICFIYSVQYFSQLVVKIP